MHASRALGIALIICLVSPVCCVFLLPLYYDYYKYHIITYNCITITTQWLTNKGEPPQKCSNNKPTIRRSRD